MERILSLTLSAKKKKLILLNDLYPSLVLLFTGLMAIQSGGNKILSIINIIFGGLMLFFGLKEWRSLTTPVRHRVQWFEVISGAVMMLDAAVMYKQWKGFQPAHLYAIYSVFLILKGFSIVKLRGIRKLIIDDDSLSIRTGPFSKLQYGWGDIKRISIRGTTLFLTTGSGEQKISLRNVENIGDIGPFLSEACKEKLILFQ